MKRKPNTKQFEFEKDPSEFIEGGAADIADRVEPKQSNATPAAPISKPMVEAKIYREQKIFRLPLDLINALKREVYERSVETNSRITETELVEQAIRAFLKI